MGTRAVAVAASEGLVVTLLVACGSGPARAPGDTSSPTVAAVELSAAAVYGRHAAVRGKVDVRLTNEGGREVDVVSYQVRHPLYEQVPATDGPPMLGDSPRPSSCGARAGTRPGTRAMRSR